MVEKLCLYLGMGWIIYQAASAKLDGERGMLTFMSCTESSQINFIKTF
jgi:hypothetical protein